MNVTITPAKLKGIITPPPSKSQAHRLIIAAALADGESVLSNVARSQDITATVACMEELGAGFTWEGDTLTVRGMGANAMSPLRRLAPPRLDCGESGSTLRFLIPVALAVRGGGVFTGRGRLMERPQKPYFDLFDEKGIFYEQRDGVLTVSGLLTPGEYRLPGDVSSQFVTGLLYALPLLNGDSVIQITTRLESLDYVVMTLDALKQFGIRIENKGWRTFRIPGGQTYQPRRLAVEADWSQAGFWYAAQGLGSEVLLLGLNPFSAQGDKIIVPYCERLGGRGEVELDVSQCPDLVPPLAVRAAVREGTTHIVNAARLRIKESDRLATVTEVLNALGAKVTEGEDNLVIEGQPSLPGGVTVSAHNDHRIAMMAAMAATCCRQPVTITGAECVAKSYPNFWEDYEALGGCIIREE
ncbi:MAG: 3-phosphoshikimate 1-carboxyvinyltransferase [Candidatus Enterenecus sp.]